MATLDFEKDLEENLANTGRGEDADYLSSEGDREPDFGATRVIEDPKPGILNFGNPSGKDWRKEQKDQEPPKKKERPSKAKIRKSVAKGIAGIGILTGKYVDEYDGKVIIHNGEALTENIMALTEEYPWLLEVISGWTSISAIGGMVGVLVNVAIPIAVHHGYAPEIAMSFVDAPPLPEVHPDVEG